MAEDKRRRAIEIVAHAQIYQRAAWSLKNVPVDLLGLSQGTEDEIHDAAVGMIDASAPSQDAVNAALEYLASRERGDES